jgi:hypothetical protein
MYRRFHDLTRPPDLITHPLYLHNEQDNNKRNTHRNQEDE